jgi:hypothetical protein
MMDCDPPATNLKDAYNAVLLDPLESYDPRYVDCSYVRGGDDVAKSILVRVENSKHPLAQLVCGHRGCGKSTELLRLVKYLEDKKFLVVYFAVDEDLDVGDLVYTDLLVAIIKRLERTFAKKGIEMDARFAERVAMWFADVIYEWKNDKEMAGTLRTDFELGIKSPLPLPILAKMLAKITGQIRTGHSIRKEVRLKLDPHAYELIERINEFIMAAYPEIKKKGYEDLVIVIDNLDRIVLRILDEQTGRTTHDIFFLEHSKQLNALAAHMVYTVPISMFYSAKATQLTEAFPNYSMLPMIKVHEEDNMPYEKGIERLYEVAKRRIDIKRIFDDDVVEFLAKKSGGCLRDFIRLLSSTIELAQIKGESIPINRSIAELAFRRLVNEYSRMVPYEHFRLLAKVSREKRAPNNLQYQSMLYNLSVLEYMNGRRWCDVHPAIMELPELKGPCDYEPL